MFKKIMILIVMMVLVTSVTWAQGKYSIKEMTPAVQKALDGRKERFSQVRSLKASGSIGENNQGYVEVIGGDSDVSVIVSQENKDRKIIYQTIAQQNGLEGALSTIEAAFAEVQRDKAEVGDKIQSEDGRWISK